MADGDRPPSGMSLPFGEIRIHSERRERRGLLFSGDACGSCKRTASASVYTVAGRVVYLCANCRRYNPAFSNAGKVGGSRGYWSAPDGAEVSHDGAEVVFPRGGDSIQYLCWRAYLRFECRLLEKTIPRPAVLGLRSEDGDIYLPRTRIDVRVGLFRIHALSRDLGGRCTVTLLSGAPAAFREIDRVNGEMDFGGACPNCGEWIHPHWDPDADSG